MKTLLAAAAAISAIASAAHAAPCVQAPVGVYTASGFSCSVGPVTFSDIVLTTTVQGSGEVKLTDFNPFVTTVGGVKEYGLELTYQADSGFLGGAADISWSYDVSAHSLTDAVAGLVGGTVGASAVIALDEALSNGATLSLDASGIDSATFAPIDFLSVIKDQTNIALPGNIAFSSEIANGFSVAGVPEPRTWALMSAGFALLALAGWRRRDARFVA